MKLPEHPCQCPGTIPGRDDPCGRAMTQEDLLCDHCRATCLPINSGKIPHPHQQYIDLAAKKGWL